MPELATVENSSKDNYAIGPLTSVALPYIDRQEQEGYIKFIVNFKHLFAYIIL